MELNYTHIMSTERTLHISYTYNEPENAAPNDIPALTRAEAGTRFSDPGGMQG